MLLEREGLLESLGEHLDDAAGGEGSLLLVAGEAGSGKTSLVRAFVGSLDDSTLVIQGACDPLTTPRPLSPLYDFAADPDSGLSNLEFDGNAIETFNHVLDRLRHTIRPIVMVIEDVHWADEATLDFLRFIGRRVADSKAVVVCTYRDDEVGPDHPLRPVLGQLLPLDSTHRMVVAPLTLAAVKTLSHGHVVDPADLLRLTDGNAFYVTEVLAAGHSLPHTVQEAVLARVGRLEERPRRIVEGVSVAPRSLDVEHASTLVGATPEDIDSALAAGVLVSDGRTLRFRHELARAAVEDALPPARRLSLHQKMLALLDEDDRPDLARLAHHAVRSGDVERIVEYAPLAARQAAARGAHKEAIALFEATLDQDRMTPAEQARARIELAGELAIVDQTEKALPLIEAAADFYRAEGDLAELGRSLIQLSRAHWRLNDTTLGWDALDDALELLGTSGPPEVLAEAQFHLAYLHMLARHGRLGREAIAAARESAGGEPSSDLAWRIGMLEGCMSIVVGEANVGIDQLRRSTTQARELDDPGKVSLALSMLGSGGGESRVYEDALPALEESVSYGLAHDEDYSVTYSRSWQARIAFEQGRWDDAVELAELVATTVLQGEGIAYLTAMSALGRVRVRRGDPGGRALLDEMVAITQSHELQHSWNAYCGRAEDYWLAGRPEAGLDELAPAYERALDTESEWARGEIGFWMWRVGAIEGPPRGAAEPFALQMAGRWRAAADAWEEIGCPYEVAMALADGSEEAKLDALEIFDALAARPMADRVRSELRAMGVASVPRGPTRQTRANPAGLTPRQLEVVGLMSGGLSNDQIAEQLYLSKKTVEHHVSAIYSKLGVGNRDQAIAAAAEVGAVEK